MREWAETLSTETTQNAEQGMLTCHGLRRGKAITLGSWDTHPLPVSHTSSQALLAPFWAYLNGARTILLGICCGASSKQAGDGVAKF